MAYPFDISLNFDFSGIDWGNLVLTPTPVAAQESGTIGATSIVAQNQPTRAVNTQGVPSYKQGETDTVSVNTQNVAPQPKLSVPSYQQGESDPAGLSDTSESTPITNLQNRTPVEKAQDAVAKAQAELDALKGKGNVSGTVAASKALSAAKRELTAAEKGVDTAGKTRAEVLAEQRAVDFTAKATERASTEVPVAPGSEFTFKGYDITNRPDAPPADDDYVYYYSWIGGSTTGQWKLYRAPKTEENIAKYGSRAVGGKTQAEFGTSTGGANALIVQPKPIKDADGNITGYEDTASSDALYDLKRRVGYGIDAQGNPIVFGDPNKNGNNGITTDGTGDKTNPFKVNGKPFTGTMNGKKYVNGIIEASDDGTTDSAPSTSTDILKSMLRGLGYPTKLIDSSTDFLQKLLKEGLDYDNAVSIFLNSKDYTFKDGVKIQSPFYSEYGIYNEGLLIPKTPDELFNAVEGYKDVVAKYKLNPKFASTDSIKKYVKNSKTVADLDADANMARLKGITADPYYLQALQVQGFIKSGADLTDFFLDPDIGKEQLETNKATAALTSEVLRRARTNPQAAGISVDTERLKSLSANLQAKGYTAAGVGQQAETAYGVISQQLPQLSMLSGAFEKGPTNEAQRSVELQKELESEQLLGMASERRKRLEQQNINIFSGASGRGLLVRPRYGAI